MTNDPSSPAPAGAAQDIQLLQELVKMAEQRLPAGTWDYLIGGSETETTLKRNRQALDQIGFRPRVLRDVSKVDCTTTLLGMQFRAPVMLAPIGSLQDLCPGAGAVAGRGAHGFGIPMMLSSVCKPELEEVARAAPGPKIFQLYVRGDAAWIDAHVHRAQEAGYDALCLTVDLDHYSRRERDLAKRYVTTARRSVTGSDYQAQFSWDDVKRIQDTHSLPVILKGIATAEDAALAVSQGVDAIYISNHGGRQLDHGRGAIDVVPEVAAQVQGAVPVIVDGGFMRGTDVVKAIALGADAVGLGRLFGFAIAAAGEAGVRRMLEIVEREIITCMGLLGVRCLDELDSSYLHPVTPARPAHVFSAFPLLEEGY